MTYFSAGSLWAQRPGRPSTRTTPAVRRSRCRPPRFRRPTNCRRRARPVSIPANRRSRSSSSTGRTPSPTPSSSARPMRCRRTRQSPPMRSGRATASLRARGDFRLGALRLAGAEGLAAGAVAVAGLGAPDEDRRLQDHRRELGRAVGNDRQTGHQRSGQLAIWPSSRRAPPPLMPFRCGIPGGGWGRPSSSPPSRCSATARRPTGLQLGYLPQVPFRPPGLGGRLEHPAADLLVDGAGPGARGGSRGDAIVAQPDSQIGVMGVSVGFPRHPGLCAAGVLGSFPHDLPANPAGRAVRADVFHLDLRNLSISFILAIVGLGLNEAAYMAEIIRAGISSVPEGQFEASTALGMSWWMTMRRIVLPRRCG